MAFSKFLVMKLIVCLLFLHGGYPVVSGYNILSVFLLCGRSSMNYFDAVHLELAKRGHTITVISPTPGLVKHENIIEFPGVDFKKLFRGMSNSGDYFIMRLAGERMANPFGWKMSEKFASDCDAFYQLPAVQQVLRNGDGDTKDSYDLVMTMAFMNECVYGLFDFLNTSSVIIGATPTMPWFLGATGTPTLTSFVPHIYFPASHQMTFSERLGNFVSLAYQLVSRSFVYAPQIESIYRKYIPNAAGIDSVEKNVSMYMGAGHPSFGPLRPSMPNLIDDIGGIHCRPAKPLPNDITSMITDENGRPQDFIFFSLGSIVQSHQVPDHIKNAFLTAFGKLKGKFQILWKWEDHSSSASMKIPDNVKLSKWYPQQDLLGHPNCKLFITHGGLSSLHETIYHGVPVLGIPFFGDQDWNMRQVEYHGIGETLELADISQETLSNTLEKMLNTPNYMDNVKYRSKLFRDRQISALDTAVWNIEYIIRHGGATHLSTPARNMNTIQYYSVDVLSFIFGLSVMSLYIFTRCCCHIYKKVFANKKNTKTSKKD